MSQHRQKACMPLRNPHTGDGMGCPIDDLGHQVSGQMDTIARAYEMWLLALTNCHKSFHDANGRQMKVDVDNLREATLQVVSLTSTLGGSLIAATGVCDGLSSSPAVNTKPNTQTH